MTKDAEPGLADIEAMRLSSSKPQPCPPPTGGGNPSQPYALPGPQVEFTAAYWLDNGQLRTPTLQQVVHKLGPAGTRPYPQDPVELAKEIDELKRLERQRDQEFPPGALSDFINLQNPPFGAIINGSAQRTQYRVDFVNAQDTRITRLAPKLVVTGRELARMFENETPGLLHRHALNWFLYQRADISPPRQARIWAALDLAIHAALAAAWNFKWAGPPGINFRQRPVEYDPSLSVLFDAKVNDRGTGDGDPRDCPCPSPGTPRHPAYPSGHSTYSAAGSRLLQYFFRDTYSTNQLQKLADNIGEARLWAGVHWPTDHTFGQALGRAVAEVIIDQLMADCVPPVDTRSCQQRATEQPPSAQDLQRARQARQTPCPSPQTHDEIPPRDKAPRQDAVF
jgi:membrane-associated phospholipid phosphatase